MMNEEKNAFISCPRVKMKIKEKNECCVLKLRKKKHCIYAVLYMFILSRKSNMTK